MVTLETDVGKEPTDVDIYNNAFWAPSAGSPDVIYNPNAVAIVTATNSSDAQAKNTQPFTNAAPDTPAEFVPQGYASTGGTAVAGVYLTYNGTRIGYGNAAPTVNIGAV